MLWLLIILFYFEKKIHLETHWETIEPLPPLSEIRGGGGGASCFIAQAGEELIPQPAQALELQV